MESSTGSLNEGDMVNSDTSSITVYFDVSVGVEWGGVKEMPRKGRNLGKSLVVWNTLVN